MIEIWTDGSCNNRTKVNGGCGIVLKYGEYEKHLSLGQFIRTTSARCEIKAMLEALKLITNKTIPITLYCDNRYCVDAITKGYALRWEADNWIDTKADDPRTKRKNADLWQQVLVELRKFNTGLVTVKWCKGHTKDNKYNILADKLAGQGAKSPVIIDDKMGS